MQLTNTSDAESAAALAASHVASCIGQAIDLRGVAHVLLAGGSTPRRAYELLSEADVEWAEVVLWLGDERMLPAGHPERNGSMVEEALISRIDGPRPGLRQVPVDTRADRAAETYEKELRYEIQPNAEDIPELDLAILGLGEDGHTASIFPGLAALREADRLVVGVNGAPKPPADRVTVTFPLLFAAREVLLLATGANKAGPLATLRGDHPEAIPAGLLPLDRLLVIADRAATEGP